MTVASTTNSVSYAGNGVSVAFPVPFYFLANAHLLVTLRSAAGVETTQVLTTNYSVTGAAVPAGGTVTMVAAPASGDTLLIRRSPAVKQELDYVPNDPFPAESHEKGLDLLTMIAQDHAYLLGAGGAGDGRVLKLRETDVDGSGAYDARGNRITNLGDATEVDDAVPLSQMQDYVSSTIGSIGGYVVPLVWTFTGDGTTSVFAIPGATTASPNAYHAAIDGLLQTPTTDFSIALAPATITFSPAPPPGAAVLVRATGYASPFLDIVWDAEGDRLVNLGDGIAATDAVNLGQLTAGLAGKADVGHTHNATDITAGQMNPDRLGSGSRVGSNFLRDDGVWASISGSLALPAVAKGDLFVYDGSSVQRLALGSEYQVLRAQASQPLGLVWTTLPFDNLGQIVDEFVANFNGTGFFDSATISWSSPGGYQIEASIVAGSIGTSQLTDLGVTAGKLAANAVTTAKIADANVTTAKIADANVTLAKLSATGTPDATKYLRGDYTWAAISAFATASHTHAAADVTSGIFNQARLASGFGAIPPGDESMYFACADGSWAIPIVGGGGGGGWSNEASQDAVGAIMYATATITPTYNDAGDSMTWDVNASSIGLTQVNTASLDTRYALVGSGFIPVGGTTAQFLRGDGVWSSTIAGSMVISGVTHASTGIAGPDALRVTANTAGAAPFARVALDTFGQLTAALQVDPSGGAGTQRGLIVAHSGGSYTATIGATGAVVTTNLFGQVNITEGNLSLGGNRLQSAVIDAAGGSTIAADRITSGIIAVARLGSGTPSSANYLRGDGAWVAIPGAAGITAGTTATIALALDGSNNLTGNVVAASIAAASLASGAVTTAKIGDAQVTTAKLVDASVTTAKLLDGNVTASKIAASAITSAHILAGAVVTAGIANGAVTPVKLSASSGTADASSFYRGDGVWAVPAGSLPALAGASKVLRTNTLNTASEWYDLAASANAWTGLHSWASSGGGTTLSVSFPTSAAGSAGLRLTRNVRPSADRSGSAHLTVTRDGGSAGNCFFHEYDVSVAHTAGFDIGMTSYNLWRNLAGGVGMASWLVAMSPRASQTWSSGSVVGQEINCANRFSDFGLIEDRRAATRYTAGNVIVADAVAGSDGGAGSEQFHGSFGTVYAYADSAGGPGWYIPVYIEEDSIAPGGYGIKIWGGSVLARDAARAIKLAGRFTQGIDLSGATIAAANQPAVVLATNQRIALGAGAYIWFDGTNIKATNGGSTVTVV